MCSPPYCLPRKMILSVLRINSALGWAALSSSDTASLSGAHFVWLDEADRIIRGARNWESKTSSMKTADPELMRAINRFHVMDAIRRHGPVSRVQICQV